MPLSDVSQVAPSGSKRPNACVPGRLRNQAARCEPQAPPDGGRMLATAGACAVEWQLMHAETRLSTGPLSRPSTPRWALAYAGAPGLIQVSTSGGLDPQWRGDGRELFFLSDDDRLNVAQVSAQGDRFEVGAVGPLFELPKIGPRITYDVSPDGQRILAVTWRPQSATAPLTFVVDWPGLMRK